MADLNALAEVQLKACPFCGYTARLVRARPTDPAMVTCNGPDCTLHNAFYDEAHAIEAWNRRAPIGVPTEALATEIVDKLVPLASMQTRARFINEAKEVLARHIGVEAQPQEERLPGGYVQARLRRGSQRNGWWTWWLVDDDGNQLNTEEVCITPEDKWHPWFVKKLEAIRVPYMGLARAEKEKRR